jgi:hypothetical protein
MVVMMAIASGCGRTSMVQEEDGRRLLVLEGVLNDLVVAAWLLAMTLGRRMTAAAAGHDLVPGMSVCGKVAFPSWIRGSRDPNVRKQDETSRSFHAPPLALLLRWRRCEGVAQPSSSLRSAPPYNIVPETKVGPFLA